MKTPEEIKKGLELCDGKFIPFYCAECPYNKEKGHCDRDNKEKIKRDVIALINRLEGDNIAKAIVLEKLEREKKDLLEERELNEFLRDKVKELEAQLPKWISVAERLPEKYGFYLVATKDCVTIMEWTTGNPRYMEQPSFVSEVLGRCNGYVTHWMPLPEPPKEE